MARIKFQNPVTALTVEINAHDCPACGMIYGLTSEFEARRLKDGVAWYCPCGHKAGYSTSELDRQRERAAELERQLTREKSSTLWYQEHTRDLEQQVEAKGREAAAAKGVATKLRKRIANGVCPECNRHFVHLERHMHSKHVSERASK